MMVSEIVINFFHFLKKELLRLLLIWGINDTFAKK